MTARATPTGGAVLALWMKGLAARLVRRAARNAPASLAARLEEEWLADLSERRGGMARLRFALGCTWAATLISADPGIATAAASASAAATPTGRACVRPRAQLFRRDVGARASGRVLCDINTTPLIDVMLVLLVTLIVSLPLMTHEVRMDLPEPTPHLETTQPPAVDLEIDADGTVVWDGTALAGAQQLESHFRAAAHKEPQPEVHLRADRRAKYDYVARVLASAQRNRMQKVGFVDTTEFKD